MIKTNLTIIDYMGGVRICLALGCRESWCWLGGGGERLYGCQGGVVILRMVGLQKLDKRHEKSKHRVKSVSKHNSNSIYEY